MPAPPRPTIPSIPSASSDELQSQNNTIQIIAVVFAVLYGIPLMFAAYIQWKTYLVARGRNDLEHQGIPLVTASKSPNAGPSDEETEIFDRHASNSRTEENRILDQHAKNDSNDDSAMDEGTSGEDISDNKPCAGGLL
ncbi:MAG: hypothetical protein Q9183_002544 [Haloplaca sp. 2 TL-2023]